MPTKKKSTKKKTTSAAQGHTSEKSDLVSSLKKNLEITLIVVAIAAFLLGAYADSWQEENYGQKHQENFLPPQEDHSAHHEHDHDEDLPHSHDEHAHHEHGRYDVQSNPPSMDLMVIVDEKAGYALYLQTQEFTFTPENANLEHVDNQGHAHLFIDGKKITRLYSDWYYIPELEPGTHEITVYLSTNDHNDYYYDGQAIMDSETVTVS